MPAPMIAALFFTVALLVTKGYFILGSIPLLTLKHDTAMDARFVSSFFNLYYRAAMLTASATSLSLAFAGMAGPALGAAALALIAALLRKQVVPRMASLGERIQSNDQSAIQGFRRTHLAAIVISIAQLVGIVWSLIALSR